MLKATTDIRPKKFASWTDLEGRISLRYQSYEVKSERNCGVNTGEGRCTPSLVIDERGNEPGHGMVRFLILRGFTSEVGLPVGSTVGFAIRGGEIEC
jgi:hypothetical protein